MKKVIIYYSFIIVSIMALTGFLQAQTIAQITSAVLFFPIAIYFALLVIPKNRKSITVPQALVVSKNVKKTIVKNATEEKPIVLKKLEGLDIDKRMFLKLIGSAGLTVFFFSIFTKKAEGAFFGSAPGPGVIALKDTTGNKIDPAEKHPTDGYKISQIDDSSPAYYGFVEKGGAWFIQQEDSSGNYRYTKGNSSFSTNWTNRASLTYDYFDVIF